MKYTYEVIQEQNIVIRTDEDGVVACIPMNEANSDYQEYLNPSEAKTI
jgi:hypothetical protein